jgi:hypothetical protein
LTITFTICSNNYLAQAKTLGESFIKFHPDIKFFIGLVDEKNPSIDYLLFDKFTIIEVGKLGIAGFEDLVKKYDITELNTAVKPFYFKFFFREYSAEKVIYLDPDILIFSKFTDVIKKLNDSNIVLTPHMYSPVDDDKKPTDYHTLLTGVFNLGFLALSDYLKVKGFIDWWSDRVVKYGFGNLKFNQFYDQLWMNYVPVFFENCHILRHPGYNMSNWNFHERWLDNKGADFFMVNKKYPLIFFHYSGYKFEKPEEISHYHTRYDFDSRTDLQSLFSLYYSLLKTNNIEFYSKVPCAYFQIYKAHNTKYQKRKNKKDIYKNGKLILKKFLRILLPSKAFNIFYL